MNQNEAQLQAPAFQAKHWRTWTQEDVHAFVLAYGGSEGDAANFDKADMTGVALESLQLKDLIGKPFNLSRGKATVIHTELLRRRIIAPNSTKRDNLEYRLKISTQLEQAILDLQDFETYLENEQALIHWKYVFVKTIINDKQWAVYTNSIKAIDEHLEWKDGKTQS